MKTQSEEKGKRARRALALSAVAVLLAAVATTVAAIEPAVPVDDGTTVRTSAGAPGSGGRELPAVSANGRWVAYVGRGPGKGLWLTDRWTGTTEQLTTDDAFNPAISDDGRFIAYADYGSGRPVKLFDRDLDSSTVVSVSDSEGPASGIADYPALDATGRFVAFQSTDPNLDPRVTPAPAGGGPNKVYVRDTLLGETHMASVNDDGVVAQGNAVKPDMTPDGQIVAFASDAPNLVEPPVVPPAAPAAEEEPAAAQQVYVHDRTTATTEWVSVDHLGNPGDAISAGEYGPTISGDGRFVAFESDATNLVAGDTNGDRDAFVHDRDTDTTIRVSVDVNGTQIDVPDPEPEPTTTTASTTSTTVPDGETPSAPAAGAGPAISGNGLTVAFESAVDITDDDVNEVVDVYLYDLAGDELAERASVAIAGGTDATGTRVDGNTGETVPQINGHDAAIGWSGLDVVFNGNGDLAADRPAEEEEAILLDTTTTAPAEEVSTEPAVFTRTRVLNLPAGDTGFADVPPAHLFAEEIGWAVEQGITEGYLDGLFHPTASLTRQGAAAFLWRLAGSPAGAPDPDFPDVPDDSPFAEAIAWIADEGITIGYADGTFRPTIPVSRGAFSAFLHRFAEAPAAPFPDPGYPDVAAANTFYGPVAWATANGLIGGYNDGTFRPASTVTRQSAVVILYRFVPVAAVS